ncbi:DUF2975 domain-containing protein [Kribbella sp. NPDC023855]|uniref:DUF2975 domain-containing protein n=1 Tax=Kribbella sp. NPDC023855 TaxID=3154698 RepID=UPI0033FCE543
MRLSVAGLDRWGRTDTVVLQGLLAGAFVLEAVIGLVVPLLGVAGLLDMSSSRTVALADAGALGLPAADGVELSATGTATLAVADPGLGQRVLLELPGVFAAVLILLGIWLLFQVARTLSAGEPFASRNPLRLYGIAVLLGIGYVVGSLLTAVTTNLLVAGTPLEQHVPFSADISLLPVAVAVLLAALAEAFRIGVRLREDTEGLI